ncbi:flavin prenyltransferase UbiX [Dechloromonas sp. HYN0024]|uniref:flavin prenyltransferase UbiX n=1 Tax=Dechloromonas sp. HYN0024 TaxID=2231055 RepID=UPI000E43A535|nr:flavin prenyltransferase UbiX [Dechloromonas sp. HYN0024]AXS78630.1 UbiX family flavin prenyltransferase [Dechloromonas sp. HYN0024]
MPKTICLALTGASGMPYGLRLLECLLAADCTVQLLYSQAAQVVSKQEMDFELPSRPSEAKAALLARFPAANPENLAVYGREEWFAPVASGTNPPDAMVVCPCSMGTLAAIAQGLSDNLIERAADVVIKEGRKLVLVPRETPFSTIHLENMLRLSRAGVVILPPSPGFYHHPQSVQDVVDFIVARVMDQIGVPHTLMQRWGA